MICEAEDGSFYVNPVIQGDDAYFQLDEDGPHILIKLFKNSSPTSARRRAVKAIKVMKLRAKVTGIPEFERTVLPPSYENVVDCYRFGIELKGPIPTPTWHKGILNSSGMMLRYTWNLKLRVEDADVKVKDINPRLFEFVTGLKYTKTLQEQCRHKVIKFVRKGTVEGDYIHLTKEA